MSDLLSLFIAFYPSAKNVSLSEQRYCIARRLCVCLCVCSGAYRLGGILNCHFTLNFHYYEPRFSIFTVEFVYIHT